MNEAQLKFVADLGRERDELTGRVERGFRLGRSEYERHGPRAILSRNSYAAGSRCNRQSRRERQMSLIDHVLSDPAASYWLKDAIKAAVKRDAIDALRDAGTLVRVLQERTRALAGLL